MSDVTVDSVEAIGVCAPTDEPFGYAQSWVDERTATLVRVEASDGTVGWGECWGPVEGTGDVVESVLAPHVVDENPLEVERLYDRLYDVGRATYQTIVPLPAISGLDIALWDLAGKLQGVSTATLLGGRRRESIRPYATGHYFKPVDDLEEQYDRIAAEARTNATELGAVKLKVGLELLGYGPREDVELVRRVREAVGPKTTMMVDANYAYDRRDARRVGRELESLDVEWFEEPVQPEDLEGYAELRETLEVPVAGGECHTPAEFDRLLETHAVDVAQPDVCIVGGLTPARRIARRARDHGVSLVPHVWGTSVSLGASLQLVATLDGRPWLEFDRSSNPLREELAAESFAAEDGRVSIPDDPGLGVDLDADAIDRYRA
ncbi:mandelate racemase/muconate lactonizing enzyme family protein [Halorarum halophilum]|uniref:Mandelate racemase/muconate lactonizing enzyme family protein n=1 Tax=Halorarum halophilum TaxID=2743090 RepID=A0A7D5GZ96_9EURY|nr:mandelate racemase/muconate lactonizing enzyme family protein [Halobaculum halophilum]QLG27333.1 mandelate racemase/muconate lactonizing enzyme family protein [Halobaculum halophilum]